jgi:hypothetical protein
MSIPQLAVEVDIANLYDQNIPLIPRTLIPRFYSRAVANTLIATYLMVKVYNPTTENLMLLYDSQLQYLR